ncbi:MAG: DUF86 domain-containing protein [Ilumatobacteraceae bacterium]
MTSAISAGIEEFVNSGSRQAVVSWRLYRLAEWSSHLPIDIRQNYPTVEWRELKKLRNRLAHHFASVNPTYIFVYAAMDVPKMRHALGETRTP